MSVVIDANALVALSVLEPEAPAISAQIEVWAEIATSLDRSSACDAAYIALAHASTSPRA